MIALLAAGRAEIGTLAAVTFTRKAAAQLRGRFQVDLERARLAAKDGAVRDPARRRPDRPRAGLHRDDPAPSAPGFSASGRSKRAIDPDFRELEEHEDRVLREEALGRISRPKARLENEAALRGLDEAGLEPVELESAFATLAGFAEVEPAPGRDGPPDFGPARRALEDLLELGRVLVPRSVRRRAATRSSRPSSARSAAGDNMGFADPRRLAETIELFEKELGVTKIRWAPATEDRTLGAIGRIVGRAAVEEARARAGPKGT